MSNPPLSLLVVEDTPNKKRRLLEFISSHPELFAEPDIVICTAEASRRLREKQYDLMLLDVVVPFKAHGDPTEQNSMDLLSRLDSGINGIIRPQHVLMMSSANNLTQSVHEFLKGRPWGCVHYSEESNQSLEDIERIARWIHKEKSLGTKLSTCDVFAITALEEPEFTALETALGTLEPLEPLDSSQLIRYGRLTSGTREIRIAIAFAARMGPVASAILTTKVLEALRPKFVVMTGICGAIAKKAEIGDVVAADSSWDWQSGKYVNEGSNDFEIAPHQVNVDDPKLRSCLTLLKRDDAFWAGFMSDAMKLKLQTPKLVIGPMATGAAVVADERVTKKIREEQHKNVVGVDMETYAVYAAAKSAGYPVSFLSLKSVCDRADVAKNDEYQSFAAAVSATAAVHFIKKYGESFLPSS
jgi:nucleoside phosphorylase/CheY-like chemotaxis protein